MGDVRIVLWTVTIICAFVAAITAVVLTRGLDKRGLSTPFPFMGLFLFRNLRQYKEITLRDTGSVGPLYHAYIISINAAWILALAALAVRVLGV